jgi:hypothetical protein
VPPLFLMPTTYPATMIQSITARLNHPQASEVYKNCYCFDNPEMDLIAEPFVHSTTEVIKKALEWCKYPPSQFVELNFTDSEDLAFKQFRSTSWPTLLLNLLRPDNGGHDYGTLCLFPERAQENWANEAFGNESRFDCWLCPVLLQYFPEPPKEIYCQVKPIYRALA